MQSHQSTACLNDFIHSNHTDQKVGSVQVTQDMWVQSIGQEDSLEEVMATQSSSLAWKIPWTEDPRGLQSMGWQRVRHD